MRPGTEALLAKAVVASTTLPARITGAVVRARHRARSDRERIDQLEAAGGHAAALLQAILLAELALRKDRREGAEP